VLFTFTDQQEKLQVCCLRSQITDIQQEHQREMEGLLENVRQLSRELRQHMLVIDQFTPPEYQVSDDFFPLLQVHCRVGRGGSVAEWLACWTQAQKGLGLNRSRDAVG